MVATRWKFQLTVGLYPENREVSDVSRLRTIFPVGALIPVTLVLIWLAAACGGDSELLLPPVPHSGAPS